MKYHSNPHHGIFISLTELKIVRIYKQPNQSDLQTLSKVALSVDYATANSSIMNGSDFASILNPVAVKGLVQAWLKEDIPSFDFGGIVVGDKMEQAVIICKKDGVISGFPFINEVFKELNCEISWLVNEGDRILAPYTVANVSGPARNMFLGERLALNILSRASGVATIANNAKRVASAKSWRGSIAGTRKTTPGFRLVEKYSLLVGGVAQHRNDLSSMVMLKDNHIWTAGDINKVSMKSFNLVRQCHKCKLCLVLVL